MSSGYDLNGSAALFPVHLLLLVLLFLLLFLVIVLLPLSSSSPMSQARVGMLPLPDAPPLRSTPLTVPRICFSRDAGSERTRSQPSRGSSLPLPSPALDCCFRFLRPSLLDVGSEQHLHHCQKHHHQ